jgi:aerobic-type carbon monoxide dehydrogenase small subunit (CoxS/CutS family)
MKRISFSLNGVKRNVTVDETRMLLWVLRDDLGLTGTKFGCGEAVCAACTVLLDNEAVRACVTPMKLVDGKKVVTIEGLAHDEKLNPVQEAFVKHLGFQCGYCTSGMIMGAHALLLKNPKPTRTQIIEEMEPHLCRCGAHVRIVEAIESASAAIAGGAR